MNQNNQSKPDITNGIQNGKLDLDFDALPAMISVKALEPYFSRHSILAMFHAEGFPYVKIGKAFYSPKLKFIEWLLQRSETEHTTK